MQARHRNRRQYFNELALTSLRYFMPYVRRWNNGSRILEIGCGDGGNLLPFAQAGCYTLGVDMAEERIADARRFFSECRAKGDFIASDVFLLKGLRGKFDVILCHDVIEHISDNERFLSLLPQFLAKGGVIFMSFPAWRMPFGGHQQICRNRLVSHLPYIHLLPTVLYRLILRMAGEDDGCINELLQIKLTRTPIAMFERALQAVGTLTVTDRQLWLINPHHEAKFGLRPRRLPRLIATLPGVRDFFTTSCFYLLKPKQ